MKTIKIFLASSEELENDRNAFGNLIRRLNQLYDKRGVRIELFEWEDYDAAYNNRRKQDEYNEQVRASDMFLALFHLKAGKFTIEEFDVATEEFKRTGKTPKAFVYCRDLQVGEKESSELVDFKRRLFEEMGHYWCRYNNSDSMQLHFVMQLQLVENSHIDDLKVEDGNVLLDDKPIARLDKLQFAAGNAKYKEMSEEMRELSDAIEMARKRVEKFPNDEDLGDDLQKKLNKYNKLKVEFAQLQKALFETAKRIAAMQLDHVSDMLRRAIEAFEEGRLERANTLLDEISYEAEHHFARLEQDCVLIHQDIEAFLLQAKTVMADVNIPIQNRIERVEAIYKKADSWAEKSGYDSVKYFGLLLDYCGFLNDSALYNEALVIGIRLMSSLNKTIGLDHPSTIQAYKIIGVVYLRQGNHSKALDCFIKALDIRSKMMATEHLDTVELYNNIGCIYESLFDYSKALESYYKALYIGERILGAEHSQTALTYNNIGLVYYHFEDDSKAIEYFQKAIAIQEKLKISDIAATFNNIGLVYHAHGDYSKALDYYQKGLAVCEKVFGVQHPDTATAYNNFGRLYVDKGDYLQAMNYYNKALSIREKVLGINHLDTANSYNSLGDLYDKQENYSRALYYYKMALPIFEKVLGENHTTVADTYNSIATMCICQREYTKALTYYFMALTIYENNYGIDSRNTADTYDNIGMVYGYLENYPNAIKFFNKALIVYEKILGELHPKTKQIREDISAVKEIMV